MSHTYYVTAHKSTAVTGCLSGNFTNAKDINLITARGNRLVIELVSPEGIKPFKDIIIHGKIAVIKLFRYRSHEKDSLFLITARYNAMILSCDYVDNHYEIQTTAHGSVADATGRPSETGILAIIDPLARAIGLRLYDGLFKIIPLDMDNSELRATNIRMDEMQVQDVEFLHGCSNPTIALIHQDMHGRHLKSHEISLHDKEFICTPWVHSNLESEAAIIIPVSPPVCGVLIIGQESVLYYDGMTSIAVAPQCLKSSIVTCYTRLGDCYRYLLGDISGNLFSLYIIGEKVKDVTVVKDIQVSLLGEISVPECLTYLDNGVIFVGSRFGNSQLIKMSNGSTTNSCDLSILQSFTNLAPIVDMCVVDLEKQGQDQLITCSGAFKEGALKIIRNGIGIHEIAAIDLSGVKGMWPICLGEIDQTTQSHNTLVLTFVERTRFLYIIGEEVEALEIDSLVTNKKTYHCGNVVFDQILQVTSASLRLVNQLNKKLLFEWKPSTNKNSISVAAANRQQVVCASGTEVNYFEIMEGEIVPLGSCNLEFEVSCLDITPFSNFERTDYVALGLWTDMSIKIVHVPDFEEMHYEKLGGCTRFVYIIARSILMSTFEDSNYLLCSLGDGTMFYFSFTDSGKLTDRKKVTLGSQPTTLKSFRSASSTNIFACSDRPTVIHSSNRKLVFSNVNLREVNHMCSFNSEAYPDSLALATESYVMFGTIDQIQKLHIRSIQLYETPRRIVYQEETGCFGVISTRFDTQTTTGLTPLRPSASTIAPSTSSSSNLGSFGLRSSTSGSGSGSTSNPVAVEIGQEFEINSLLLIDNKTFETLHSHQFIPTEYALSILSCRLADDPNIYFIVGTALVNNDEPEPKIGRIIIFHWTDNKFTQITEKEVKGACYALAEFNGKLLAAINCTVRLFVFTKEKELRIDCSHFNNILALYLKTKGDFVLVGDLMRSVTLLQYRPMEGNFEEIARDYNPNWITAIEFIDDDLLLSSENTMNLVFSQKDSVATSDEERQLLQNVGLFHLGDSVNVFRHGSLVIPNFGETSAIISNSILVGTVSGSIGILAQLKPKLYDTLNQLQQRMSKLIKFVGKISHSFWRSFQNDQISHSSFGVIDGDLIESFLDLPAATQEVICRQKFEEDDLRNPLDIDEVIKVIEDLTRIH